MRKLIVILAIIWPAILIAQTNLEISLNQCLISTAENYPLANQKALIDAASELNQQIIQSGFSPQVILNGQVSYQSDVTYLPISLPNVSIPQTSKDWYKLNLDVSQLIYDGGALKTQKQIVASNSKIEQQGIEIELYKVKQIVQSSFFNLILLNESKKAIHLLQNELQEKLKSIESGVKNGLIIAANRDNLLAELIIIEQNLFELELGIESAIENLNILTGLELTTNHSFVLPEANTALSIENNRPEIALFDSQLSRNGLMKDLVTLKQKPKILGFGQAGYGRPALNMLSNDFELYFVIGAKLNWKIFDWGKTKKEMKVLDIQSQIIGTQKETFNTQLAILLTKKEMKLNDLRILF